ncbi:ABC transporter ATP-binding protein [Pseudobacillus wudalianchiensis]|uniref:Molybdenum ABC transporter ATP-binding protein n=1 Tax=Pseudobacillus wudalianchiensis TaxID=1743143 RepID=A0A1B9ATL1_9BACI|nr:ABC transporter ATP-binding protein [Bacillus wudalianchiensis]OCA87217.1 molybdenum ABC transporter ATP-binding protein [Bacillus wudalianchiensis]
MLRENKVIELENITWKREEREILNHISWSVAKGEHWAVLGLNGSGKTSLLKIITGYQWPTKGKVSVLGQLFGKTNIPELRKSIGWVGSSLEEKFHTRPSDSVLEVVLSGKNASIGLYDEISQEDVKKAEELLTQFRIDHLADQTYFSLSQGEKRKMMIARALMPSPKLLILDEPCNGLDLYSKEELLSTIEKMSYLPEGPTLLYVTHHIEELVPSITHALLIANGRTVAAGPKKDVLTEDVLSQTFHLPISLNWEDDRPWIRVKSRN